MKFLGSEKSSAYAEFAADPYGSLTMPLDKPPLRPFVYLSEAETQSDQPISGNQPA